MALYRFFKKQSPEVPSPNGPLSRSLSPATIKDANAAVKQCADRSYQAVPRSRGERTSSLPPKPKQPLLSTPSYMEIRLLSVITLTAKGSEMLPVSLWHGNSSSKTELQTSLPPVDMVAPYHGLHREGRTIHGSTFSRRSTCKIGCGLKAAVRTVLRATRKC